MSPHVISRVTILGTGLIGGSFAHALRKYLTAMHISGWDRPDVVREAQTRGALDECFSGDLAPALHNSDLVYIALPIAATIDLLPEIARHAPPHALVTDACSTKVRIAQAADELFSGEKGPLFLGGHPMAGRELPGITHADADLFRENTYALIAKSPEPVVAGLQTRSFPIPKETDPARDPRISALVKILEKIRARPLKANDRIAMSVSDGGTLYMVTAAVSGPEPVRALGRSLSAWKLQIALTDEHRQAVWKNVTRSIRPLMTLTSTPRCRLTAG